VLKSLYIRNHALIDEIRVEFQNGLNVLTGETGAGKSTIIESLSLLLGERANTDVVRKGAEKAVVEGVLAVAGNRKLRKVLDENDIPFADELILRREVSVKGQARCFINDTPTTLTLLATVGDLLVDLHGQHQHQSLLKTDSHIDFLDEFAGTSDTLSEFQRSHERILELIGQLKDLKERNEQLREKRELYEFQMREIDALNPRLGEEEDLEQELKILENAEKLYELTGQVYGILYENENSLRDQLVSIERTLEGLTRIDKSFGEMVKEASASEAIVDELAKTVQSYRSKIEFNPEKLDEIRGRLGGLSLLKKKYGGSIAAILERREQMRRDVRLAETFDAELQKLRTEIEKERTQCSGIAQRLSGRRKEVARRLGKAVVEELTTLGIPNGSFEVRIEHRTSPETRAEPEPSPHVRLERKMYETTSKGIDFVEFYISTNIGEDVKPLAKVASGGEISRIMLALKSILAKADRLPLLIFDEIDIGISGRIAQAVGLSLKDLSRFHQIIVITHLPQIAGAADHHYIVEKVVEGGRASTRIRELSHDDRVREVARLMSGEKVTEAGLKGARELIGMASNN
jgi:DNA repair protein RecN (Recombination protein N)